MERTSGARPAAMLALGLVPFVVLATLNSGGYRFGAADQAFYVPAVLEQLDPSLFPRDGALLATQTRLTGVDETLALIVRASGMSLPSAFALLYVLSLIVLAAGAWMIGRALYRSAWTSVALLAALTLRHAIARSGTNTLEGYFHPRVLAFGLGAAAIAAFLRGRLGWTLALLALAASVHPTTALWFGLWALAAAAIAERSLRKPIAALVIVGSAVGLWALTAGPLAGRLVPMDPEWRRLLAGKDYLFPLEWPAYAWIVNLGYLPIIAAVYRSRQRLGLAGDRERALVAGSGILLVVFIGALVSHALRIVFAVQLQPARVFWMFDLLATLYVVWWLAEGPTSPRGVHSRRPAVVATVILLLSVARGAFVLIEAERPPVQFGIRDDDWGRVMAWARTTPTDSHWLADPMHAVRYGTSVRVAGARDVFVEAVKDSAIGMYGRPIAVRTAERLRAVEDFGGLTPEGARELAARHDLDYLVTEASLDLPVAFSSGPLRVYDLR